MNLHNVRLDKVLNEIELIGTRVKTTKAYGGKYGTIVDASPSGSFVIVDVAGEGRQSYHITDLLYQDVMDDTDEFDELYESIKQHSWDAAMEVTDLVNKNGHVTRADMKKICEAYKVPISMKEQDNKGSKTVSKDKISKIYDKLDKEAVTKLDKLFGDSASAPKDKVIDILKEYDAVGLMFDQLDESVQESVYNWPSDTNGKRALSVLNKWIYELNNNGGGNAEMEQEDIKRAYDDVPSTDSRRFFTHSGFRKYMMEAWKIIDKNKFPFPGLKSYIDEYFERYIKGYPLKENYPDDTYYYEVKSVANWDKLMQNIDFLNESYNAPGLIDRKPGTVPAFEAFTADVAGKPRSIKESISDVSRETLRTIYNYLIGNKSDHSTLTSGTWVTDAIHYLMANNKYNTKSVLSVEDLGLVGVFLLKGTDVGLYVEVYELASGLELSFNLDINGKNVGELSIYADYDSNISSLKSSMAVSKNLKGFK